MVLAELELDPTLRYHRTIAIHARFGDPRAAPTPYKYGLPYGHGRVFAVLQGFHGAFSHRGSNEYAVDFDCPVATPVIATRPGVVVAVNAAAQGSGTTTEFLEDKRVNFVLVRHDDGTLGEYMHLSPSGVEVKPGQLVRRGQELALSGNTGFSSTPHLHFQVMTAADDGLALARFRSASQSRPPRRGAGPGPFVHGMGVMTSETRPRRFRISTRHFDGERSFQSSSARSRQRDRLRDRLWLVRAITGSLDDRLARARSQRVADHRWSNCDPSDLP